MIRATTIVLVAAMAVGCAHFRLDKDAYRKTRTVAIVESVGMLGEDASAPFDLSDITGPTPWHRVVTNDTLALQEFLTQQGFTVVPIDEMVGSDGYRRRGEYVHNDQYAPEGMRRFAAEGRGVRLSFMTANQLADDLGVDAIICIHHLWDQEGMLDKKAKTTVAVAMVNRRSNNVWTDMATATSAEPVASLGGLKSVDTTEFVSSYNDAFKAALATMETRITEELAQ